MRGPQFTPPIRWTWYLPHRLFMAIPERVRARWAAEWVVRFMRTGKWQ